MSGGKMQNRPLQFRRAIRIHTAMVGLARSTHHVAAAYRTMLGHFELLMTARMVFILDDFHNFWNDIAAAFHLNPVADLHAQLLDEVHVVQGGARNRRAADWNRF